jgi:Mor family transcriptional regulator
MGKIQEQKTERNLEIYRRLKSGESPMELAKEFDVYLSRIYQIKKTVERRYLPENQ